MAESRIPYAPEKFNTYINNTSEDVGSIVIPTVQTRFNWTDAEATAWTDSCSMWVKTTYKNYSNKSTRTPLAETEVKKFIAEFHNVNNLLLDRAAASTGATTEDELLYNFKSTRAKPTHQTEPIKAKVIASLEALEGGNMQARCRTVAGTGRPFIPHDLGADSVQYAYTVCKIPVDENDGTTRVVSTKAMFVIPLGSKASEERLYSFWRWYNTKNPELSGPWSKMITSAIL